MFVLLELLGIIVLESLFTIPGAIIKWGFFRANNKNTSFKECLTQGIGINYMISIFALIITSVGIALL